jgi:antitoxin component of MazEF toxin-antitoxin module
MTEKMEIRKVQAYSGDRSLTIVLPKIFSDKLKIGKGDYLMVHIENENKLVLEKAGLQFEYAFVIKYFR